MSWPFEGLQRLLRGLPILAVQEITPEEAAELLSRTGAPLLVDVRQPFEFRSGHIPGAVNAPLTSGDLPENVLEGGAEVLVVCASGHRSLLGAVRLRQAGLRPTSIRGGTAAWTRAGFPITRDL